MAKEVDCRGLNCPQPVINTKKALEEIETGRVITIVDNNTALQNVTMFAKNQKFTVETEEAKGLYYINITKGQDRETGEHQPAGKDETNGKLPQKTGTVYLVTSNTFGEGSPDLGATLMKSLLYTMVEDEPAPDALIFINSGVYLACEGSELLPYLEKLYQKGTAIISCGTCLNYYQLNEKLALGTVSNMFEIYTKISTKENKVINIA